MGCNWFGIARLRTPLQRTAVQRGPLPRWPQLSRVAWAPETVSVFQVMKRRCPATLANNFNENDPGSRRSRRQRLGVWTTARCTRHELGCFWARVWPVLLLLIYDVACVAGDPICITDTFFFACDGSLGQLYVLIGPPVFLLGGERKKWFQS